MKKIWIFHHYGTAPNKGGLVRPYDFSKQFLKKGYEPLVFSSAYNHYTHENIEMTDGNYLCREEEGVPFAHIKTKPYTTNGLDRVKNMITYFANLLSASRRIAKESGRPEVIIASCPHPLTGIAGILIARRYKIPCVIEVRDLWPESIVEYSAKLTRKNPIIQILYCLEKWLYKKADRVIFTMEGGADYIKERGWSRSIDVNKIHHVNNGVDLPLFEANRHNYQIEDSDLEDEELFKVVYTGAIRHVNNLGLLVEAAKLIKNPKIKILIWGAGNELEQLKCEVVKFNLKNIEFKGSVEKRKIPYILSKANLAILHCQHSNIVRFGTSQNKSFEYFAAGKPVLSTIEAGYDLIKRRSAGKSLTEQDPAKIAQAIELFYEIDSKTYEEMSKNARAIAKEHDFEQLAIKMIRILDSAMSKEKR